MRRYILAVGLMMGVVSGYSQTQFLAKGKIEFERKINVHRQFEPDEDGDEWYKEYISKLPKFHLAYFDLYFSDDKTVYKFNREGEGNAKNMWAIGPAKENNIMTDLKNHSSTSAKRVFEESYLIQDSVRHIEWKISNETRTIAGFECRKAVGIICDSVYVVAFYTDEILVSGGPESFNGLPGMILGLAIPRLYTTWFATKVQLIEPTTGDLAAPTKGKKVNTKSLEATLQRSLKDWGKEGQKNIWWVML